MRCTVRAVAQRQLFASTGCLDSVLRFQTGRPLNEEQGTGCRGGVHQNKAHGFTAKHHSPVADLAVLSTTAKLGGHVSMEDEAELVDKPDEFLEALGEGLKQREGVDVGLADVLKNHILKAAPAQNAVAQAKDAILKLAAERANPPQPEVDNG